VAADSSLPRSMCSGKTGKRQVSKTKRGKKKMIHDEEKARSDEEK
jgi:hypothetical protein